MAGAIYETSDWLIETGLAIEKNNILIIYKRKYKWHMKTHMPFYQTKQMLEKYPKNSLSTVPLANPDIEHHSHLQRL
jgi:catabolite regulation protein CreA